MSTIVQEQHPAGSTPPQAPAAPAGPARPEPDKRYLALRNFAISISIFNTFGYTMLGFEQPWLWPLLAVLTAYTTEFAFESLSAWTHRRAPKYRGNGARGVYEFLLPSHITALAVNMLLYANNQLLPILFGVVVAVSAKHWLQAPINGRMRHFMNPSNFGITVVLLCFGRWVSIAPPYEFTENADTYFRIMIPIILVTSGTVINALLTKRTPLVVGWLGAFAIQAFIRHWIWHVALFTALSVMTGVAFVLYTNYMVTDPGTTPSKGRAQFMFGSAVAFVYAALMVFNIVYTLFYATAIVCAVRGLGWWAAHFYQQSKQRRAQAESAAQAARLTGAGASA